MTSKPLLPTGDVAEQLGVSPDTVVRLARTGLLRVEMKLPGSRGPYLFHPDEVKRYLARKAELDEALRRLNDAV